MPQRGWNAGLELAPPFELLSKFSQMNIHPEQSLLRKPYVLIFRGGDFAELWGWQRMFSDLYRAEWFLIASLRVAKPGFLSNHGQCKKHSTMLSDICSMVVSPAPKIPGSIRRTHESTNQSPVRNALRDLRIVLLSCRFVQTVESGSVNFDLSNRVI